MRLKCSVGGDTLWASSYELYDRLSPPFQSFFESLTASHEVSAFRKAAEDTPGVYFGPRGAPENIDMLFKQSHVRSISTAGSTS